MVVLNQKCVVGDSRGFYGDLQKRYEVRNRRRRIDITVHSGKIAEKRTKPPTRFTPSTLLQAMKEIYKYVSDNALKGELKECSGIGTEATRAMAKLLIGEDFITK